MKKLLFFICTLLCANVLMATRFWVGDLQYEVISMNPIKVIIYDANTTITTANIPTTVSYNGATCSVTSIGDNAFQDCSSLTSVTIPNSITSIGNYAFEFCRSLTSVTIPNSVTSIGNYAFAFCSSLTSVTIGNSVTSIGEFAFCGCSGLTSVTIPNSVTSIGSSAFKNCSGLSSVTIPNSVTSIGGSAFRNCSSLTSVTLGNSVTSIGYDAFYNCSSLTSVTIPNSVTSIGSSAFSGCSGLTSVIIGNSVDSIGHNMFKNCSSLISVTIGNSVTYIGYDAFYGCSSLTFVTCLAINPPTFENYCFIGTPFPKTLYVRCGRVETYFNHYYWGTEFFPILEVPFELEINEEVNGSVYIERNSCSSATLTATANDCYQFVGWNDGNTENPRIVSLISDTAFTAIFEDLNTELSATICEGQVYTENNFNVSEAGVYTQTLQTVNGCDSIVTLTVSVNPTFDTTINATINPGETYAEFGFNESETGTYVQNLQTVNGCDSTITLVLSVNSSLLDVEQTELSFFPNPTKSEITFSQAIEKVEVIDLTGKAIFTFSNAKTINIESLPSGAYYLRLTNNDKAIMQKVIKE